MCARHNEFSGPTLRPLRKWFVGFAILALCASVAALGLSHGLPEWLQDLGWALNLLFLLGGSVWILWLYYKNGGKWFGQLGILPKSWVHWVLDEPESTKNSRHECHTD